MTLEFSCEGKFIINMENYVDEIIKNLPEDMGGTATTPAGEYLFKTHDNATKLDEEIAELFHHVTAQLLFFLQARATRHSHSSGIPVYPAETPRP